MGGCGWKDARAYLEKCVGQAGVVLLVQPLLPPQLGRAQHKEAAARGLVAVATMLLVCLALEEWVGGTARVGAVPTYSSLCFAVRLLCFLTNQPTHQHKRTCCSPGASSHVAASGRCGG